MTFYHPCLSKIPVIGDAGSVILTSREDESTKKWGHRKKGEEKSWRERRSRHLKASQNSGRKREIDSKSSAGLAREAKTEHSKEGGEPFGVLSHKEREIFKPRTILFLSL